MHILGTRHNVQVRMTSAVTVPCDNMTFCVVSIHPCSCCMHHTCTYETCFHHIQKAAAGGRGLGVGGSVDTVARGKQACHLLHLVGCVYSQPDTSSVPQLERNKYHSICYSCVGVQLLYIVGRTRYLQHCCINFNGSNMYDSIYRETCPLNAGI